MKYTLLFFCLLPLCSCGATGKLIGTVARLPVDIARGAAGGYDEGALPQINDIQQLEAQATLSHP